MRVAVLMSTYNGEKYLRQQIDSILEQEGNFELNLWIRDDGSTDSTQYILNEYSLQGKLVWYSGRNLGPAYSFFDLLKRCEGYDFYSFSDQDDYWNQDKLEKAICSLRSQTGPALYFANAELVNENLESYGRNVYKKPPVLDFCSLVCAGGILGCTMVFNAILADYIQNRIEPRYMVMHDYYLETVCKAIGGKIIYDNVPHIKYRQHSNNVIGVPYGIVNIIMERVRSIVAQKKVSISDQAKSILDLYDKDIEETKKRWLYRVSGYKKNMLSKIGLAFSIQTKYMNCNMGLKIRLSILLGNR